MAITAKELAAKLGLSPAAVSMALNNKPGVSTATRRRVIEAARQLGYDFSRKAVARGERRGQLCLVVYRRNGAVVGDTPFFADLTSGVSIGCKKAQYDLVIRYLYDDDDLRDQLYTLETSGFQGVILLATELDAPSMSRFSSLSAPVVVLDACFDAHDYNYVLINNVQGAFQATSYLISKRRTQPGYLRSSYPISNFEERADGFYKAIRASGMSTSKSVVHLLTPSQEGAYADMKALLEGGEEPADCYFADNDHIAIGAVRALKEAGFRVPEDVAVVGFDDLPVCGYTDPPLTTVRVPVRAMGEAAARRLTEMLEEQEPVSMKIEIRTGLVKRKSV